MLFIQKSNMTDSNTTDIRDVIWQKIKMASAKYALIHSKIILSEKQFHKETIVDIASYSLYIKKKNTSKKSSQKFVHVESLWLHLAHW